MTPLTSEWVDKAEGDFTSAGREMRARKSPNYDSACFHAQQCAEKYMKALLQDVSIAFPKTHDLMVLQGLLLPGDPFWATMVPHCSTLTDYAVRYRYPGGSANRQEARQALALCQTIRAHSRMVLGLL